MADASEPMAASSSHGAPPLRKKMKSGAFEGMGLSHSVFQGIQRKGYKLPTPIQRRTIPLIMAGLDVVAMARTGSGKTAAFVIPMLERLKAHSAKVGVRALILAPTRDLALQTYRFTKELAKYTDLRVLLVVGGDSMDEQFGGIHSNPDIVIATPGRFLHLSVEMQLSLTTVEYVVFDEADQLYEMGFAEQLQEILLRLPSSRQTLLFSATLPKLLVDFAKAGLKNPTLVRLDVDSKLSDQLRTQYLSVKRPDKPAILLFLLRHVIDKTKQTLIFCSTRHHVEYLSNLLTQANIANTYSYSSLDPTARKINVAKFRANKVNLMLVTDVAARGIDIPMLDYVINYDFPAKPKLFIHRVGRVARAGRTGDAISLVSPDEVPYLIELHVFLGRTLKIAGKNTPTTEDGVFGRVPQTTLDLENDTIHSMQAVSHDLTTGYRSMLNSYERYDSTRPEASTTSVKRAKLLLGVDFDLHPLFSTTVSPLELQREDIVKKLSSYRPKETVLEANKPQGSESLVVMASKREHDAKFVKGPKEQQRQMMREAEWGRSRATGGDSAARSAQAPETEDMDLTSVFNQIITPTGTKRPGRSLDGTAKRSQRDRGRGGDDDDEHPDGDDDDEGGFSALGHHGGLEGVEIDYGELKAPRNKRERRRTGADNHDDDDEEEGEGDDVYIPYTSAAVLEDQAMRVNHGFSMDAASAELGLQGDDADTMKLQRAVKKWDRKKKKFVGVSDNKKMIKTENGTKIAASFKSNRYQDWASKNHVYRPVAGAAEDEDEALV